MLTNTVILFLRELMPLCVLFAYLVAMQPGMFANKIYRLWLIVAAIIVPFGFFVIAEAVSDAFEGKGAEIMGISLLALHFLSLVSATFLNIGQAKRAYVVAFGAICFTTYKGSSLILYLDIYANQMANWQPLVVGSLIGLGISVSLLVLFWFLLSELLTHGKRAWVWLFWILFLSGNTAEISNLLLQINAIDWGASALFDISVHVQDSSEYGHLLNAFFGYDAMPTSLFVGIYIGCFAFASVFALAARYQRVDNRHKPLEALQNGAEVKL
jgi:high-affinity iron transporter